MPARRLRRLGMTKQPALTAALAAVLAACSTAVPATVDNVNGRQVEIATAGSGGSATVVFEAGLGEDWTKWDEVASEVADHTQIFAYSRPGYGVSDLPTSGVSSSTSISVART